MNADSHILYFTATIVVEMYYFHLCYIYEEYAVAYCFIERHINVPGTMWCKCGSLVAGTPVDGYNVISYIGHGTSGDVYLAEQPALNNRKVVIKIAHRSWNQLDIDNFRREAALLASLSHPYILPIYAYGVIYERQSPVFTYSPYLVLPYAEQGS